MHTDIPGSTPAPENTEFRASAESRLIDYARTWLKLIVGIKKETRRSYTLVVEGRMAPSPIAAIRVGQLKRQDAKHWRAELLQRGYAPQTVKMSIGVLHLILQAAVEDGLIDANVTNGLTKGLDETREPRITLELGQLNLFLEHAERTDRRQFALFVSLASAGLRIGEAIGLRPEDIHPIEPLVRVRRGVGDGGRVDTTKGKRERTVVITEEAASILRTIKSGEGGWLFPGRRSRKGPRPMSAHSARKKTKAIAASLGLISVTPKTFRRSYGHAMNGVGASDRAIADQYGHASERTTRQFYLDGAPPEANTEMVRLLQLRRPGA